MRQMNIHWLGAGLSAGPGIRRIAESGRRLTLWNRTIEKASAALEGIKPASTVETRRFSLQEFQRALQADEIVVSMLPATMHSEIAELCLAKKAHLVTTSYISDAMRAYHDEACANGLSFVNESGLDPGIDHLLAHLLVSEYRESPAFSPRNSLVFRSYCGGFPKHAGDFRYKFSWSPTGVLRALTNRAQFIREGREMRVDRAWEAVSELTLLGETFEVYPNRDSLPYLREYEFDESWKISEFVRGTIRLGGWSKAWASIFEQISVSTPESLERLGAELWSKYAYHEGEEDRVVLYVSLEARDGDKLSWSRFYALDESGTGRDTAMARLVSLPATYAIESIEQGAAPKGVSGAPRDKTEILRWKTALLREGVKFHS